MCLYTTSTGLTAHFQNKARRFRCSFSLCVCVLQNFFLVVAVSMVASRCLCPPRRRCFPRILVCVCVSNGMARVPKCSSGELHFCRGCLCFEFAVLLRVFASLCSLWIVTFPSATCLLCQVPVSVVLLYVNSAVGYQLLCSCKKRILGMKMCRITYKN